MTDQKVLGVILIGGKASRLDGQNKGLIKIGRRTCFDRVHSCFQRGSLQKICLSYPENRSSAFVFDENFTAIFDIPEPDRSRSAAWAIYSILKWARTEGFDAVITSPVDIPFLPHNYIQDLMHRHFQSPDLTIVCRTGKQVHGLNAIWPISTFEELESLVKKQAIYQLRRLHSLQGSVELSYDIYPVDPFYNINTQEDIVNAKKWSAKFEI